jgi:hypothetical protein
LFTSRVRSISNARPVVGRQTSADVALNSMTRARLLNASGIVSSPSPRRPCHGWNDDEPAASTGTSPQSDNPIPLPALPLSRNWLDDSTSHCPLPWRTMRDGPSVYIGRPKLPGFQISFVCIHSAWRLAGR